MKKLFAYILSATMFFSMPSTSFAAVDRPYAVTQDNETTRIAEDYIDGVRHVYTFLKNERKLTTQTFDANNTLISVKTICLDDIDKTQKCDEFEVDSPANGNYQHTFLNYEYAEMSSDIYELRKKDEYAYRSLPDDKEAINNYMEAVEDLNAAELTIVASVGSAAILSIISYFTAGLTAAEVAAAVGAGVLEVIALNNAVSSCERVWTLYVE